MKRELADFIIEACENADTFFQNDDMPYIYEDYSGKGMFGKKTTGIVCQNIMPVMAAIACELNESEEWNIDFELIQYLQTDSLGLSFIMY